MRDKNAALVRDRDDLEKRYLASEQVRETMHRENIDLIKDYLGSDRAYRDLQAENGRLRDEIERLKRGQR